MESTLLALLTLICICCLRIFGGGFYLLVVLGKYLFYFPGAKMCWMQCFTANIRVDEATLRFIKTQNTPNNIPHTGENLGWIFNNLHRFDPVKVNRSNKNSSKTVLILKNQGLLTLEVQYSKYVPYSRHGKRIATQLWIWTFSTTLKLVLMTITLFQNHCV